MSVRILRGAVQLKQCDLDMLWNQKNRLRNIFNPDDLRFQCRLRTTHRIVRELEKTLDRSGLLRNRKLTSPVFLFSLPGCAQQQWHTDFNPKDICHLPEDEKPAGAILALQKQTKFVQYPDKVHSLEPGDLLVFSGDVVHAGAAYSKPNGRIHCYLDSVRVERQKNRTYLFDELKSEFEDAPGQQVDEQGFLKAAGAPLVPVWRTLESGQLPAR